MYIRKGGVRMEVQVKTWGNSQGIRLSKEILENTGLQINDKLIVEVIDGNIVLKKKQKQHRHRTLEERAEEFQGKVGPYEEFDWGGPAGRERW